MLVRRNMLLLVLLCVVALAMVAILPRGFAGVFMSSGSSVGSGSRSGDLKQRIENIQKDLAAGAQGDWEANQQAQQNLDKLVREGELTQAEADAIRMAEGDPVEPRHMPVASLGELIEAANKGLFTPEQIAEQIDQLNINISVELAVTVGEIRAGMELGDEEMEQEGREKLDFLVSQGVVSADDVRYIAEQYWRDDPVPPGIIPEAPGDTPNE